MRKHNAALPQMFVCTEKFKAKVSTDYTNSSLACRLNSPTAFEWKSTGTLNSVFGFAPFVVLQVCLLKINSGYKIFILRFHVLACEDFRTSLTGTEI